MQGNATEIDERNLLQLDALLSHGYGLSPQLVMRSKGLSIEAKALYGYLSSFAGAGDTAFPSTSRILEELDISKNRFYKIRKELISWGFISIETTATSAGLRTVYTLPQNPIAIKTEIDEIANRRNEIKSSLVANLHNEDMVSHKGDSESERLQQLAGNEPCRQSEAKALNRGSNLKPLSTGLISSHPIWRAYFRNVISIHTQSPSEQITWAIGRSAGRERSRHESLSTSSTSPKPEICPIWIRSFAQSSNRCTTGSLPETCFRSSCASAGYTDPAPIPTLFWKPHGSVKWIPRF